MISQRVNPTQMVQSPAAVPAFLCRDLLSICDLGASDIGAIFRLAGLMKARPSDFRRALTGKQIVLFFEKPSLRTRLTFESGMSSMGGAALFVDQTHERLDAERSFERHRTQRGALGGRHRAAHLLSRDG